MLHMPAAHARVRIHSSSMSTDQTQMHRWMCHMCASVSENTESWDVMGVDWDRFAATWGTDALRSERAQEAVGMWWR
jgi:hypothetical protein